MSRRRANPSVNGILLVDKPGGWTSHDVVAKVRGLTAQPRAGHTGTLDPAATGLLVVCLGAATRLVEYMTGHDKRYEGEIRLGQRTTTDDAEGQSIGGGPVPALTGDELRDLERRFTGEIEQMPPAFSAIKSDGERAYRAARRGEAPVLQTRAVRIHQLHLAPAGRDALSVTLQCGAGTYVRALARDIGEHLGCGAHLAALRRTASGPFLVSEAATLAEIEALCGAGKLELALLPPDEGLLSDQAAIVTPASAHRLALGQTVSVQARMTQADTHVRVYTTSGDFVATGMLEADSMLRPAKVLLPAPATTSAN